MLQINEAEALKSQEKVSLLIFNIYIYFWFCMMIKAFTWQHTLHAGVGMFLVLYIWTLSTSYDTDAILILEHSFILSQQKDFQPILSAAKKYKASDISAKVESILQDVSMQYSTASEGEKIDMIFNVVMQNCMSKSPMYFHTSFQFFFVPEAPVT